MLWIQDDVVRDAGELIGVADDMVMAATLPDGEATGATQDVDLLR